MNMVTHHKNALTAAYKYGTCIDLVKVATSVRSCVAVLARSICIPCYNVKYTHLHVHVVLYTMYNNKSIHLIQNLHCDVRSA
jgi:hypothetical protein